MENKLSDTPLPDFCESQDVSWMPLQSFLVLQICKCCTTGDQPTTTMYTHKISMVLAYSIIILYKTSTSNIWPSLPRCEVVQAQRPVRLFCTQEGPLREFSNTAVSSEQLAQPSSQSVNPPKIEAQQRALSQTLCCLVRPLTLQGTLSMKQTKSGTNVYALVADGTTMSIKVPTV